MASVQLVRGDDAGKIWTELSSSTLIGRDSKRCDVVLPATTVSRVHAEIGRREGAFFLIDRESRAGTSLNGQRLTPNHRYRLRPGDAIEICEYVLVFASGSATDLGIAEENWEGSVTQCIRQLREDGAESAQEQLWNRYFNRLVGLARYRLGRSPRGVEDEEDTAIRALTSFFDGARDGRFPQLKDRHGLWQLLSKITARQAINQRKKSSAQKRGGGRVHTESVFGMPGDQSDGVAGLAEVIGDDPTPEFLVQMAEQCATLLDRLPAELQEIARLKLEGYTHAEIAEKLGKVERTVERKLQQIREVWSAWQD